MRRLLCLLLGHRWPQTWADNGCYTIHEHPPVHPDDNLYHDHLETRVCRRCGKVATRFDERVYA